MEPTRPGPGWSLAKHAPWLASELAVGLAALVAVAALFPGIVLGREHLWGDFATWYYPSHAFAAERMREGAWPLWNPYSDCGMPFAGEADHGSFYPPAWLLHALTVPGMSLLRGLEFFTLLHVALAILTLYGLLRVLGCGRGPALVGGLTYGLGGEFFARSGHVALVCAQAWVPVALGGAFDTLRRGGHRGALLSAGAFGLIGVSGSPATLVVSVGALLVLVAATVASQGRQALVRRALGGLIVSAAILGLGLLVAAVQLLPMWEFIRISERAAYSYDEVADYALTGPGLILLFVPRFFGWLTFDQPGYWGPNNFPELTAYVGLLPLALAALAVRLRPRQETLPWLVLAVLALWIALGKAGGLHWLLYKFVPVLGGMRAPARYLLAWALGVAVLAGLGLDALVRHNAGTAWRPWRTVLASTAAVLAALLPLLGLAIEPLLASWQQPFFSSGIWRSTLSAAGAGLGLLLLGRLPARSLAICLVLLVTNDLTLQGRGVGVVPAERIGELLHADATHLRSAREDSTSFRISHRYMNPGVLMIQRLQSDFGPGRHLLAYAEYDAHIASRESPLFDLLNIKYLADARHPAIRSPLPNLVARHYVWLEERELLSLPVDPPRRCDSLEIVATVQLIERQARGVTVGTLELVGAGGEVRVLPLRLGIELGEIVTGGPVSAGHELSTPEFIDVTDAATRARHHYLTTLSFAELSVTAIRVRHPGGPWELAVKGLYLGPSASETAVGWKEVGTEASADAVLRLYENSNVLPRAMLVPHARAAASREQALAWVSAEGFDPRREIVLEGLVAGATPSPDTGPGSVELRHYEPERVDLAANVPPGGSWLFLSEVFYPGWNARIDDQPTPILRANGLFRAVWLGAGARRISFQYEPRSFAVGGQLSLVGLFALLALALWSWRSHGRAIGSAEA